MKENTKNEEEDIGQFPLLLIIFCGIIIAISFSMIDFTPRLKDGSYPLEILQPVKLETLPYLVDKDTKGIIFIKNGCLKASRDELEAIRDKNGSNKDVYIIGGHPVKVEVKFCQLLGN